MGIGHAITRDFLSFLKHRIADDFGNPNPVAMPGGIRAIYSWGRSNGGRNQRDFFSGVSTKTRTAESSSTA